MKTMFRNNNISISIQKTVYGITIRHYETYIELDKKECEWLYKTLNIIQAEGWLEE